MRGAMGVARGCRFGAQGAVCSCAPSGSRGRESAFATRGSSRVSSRRAVPATVYLGTLTRVGVLPLSTERAVPVCAARPPREFVAAGTTEQDTRAARTARIIERFPD